MKLTLAALILFVFSLPTFAAPCKFKVVPTPKLFKTAAGEDTEIKNAVAFITPTCKIVALGAYTTGSIYIGRFMKGGLTYDTTYGTNGIVKQTMKSRYGNYAMKLQPLKGKIALIGFAWNESDWTGGLFISFMNPEGIFDDKAYGKGMGYKMLIANHSSTDFKILKMKMIKDKIEIQSSYFDRAANKVIVSKTLFLTMKPKLVAKKIPIPADCGGNWNYDGIMTDGLALDIQQTSCSNLTLEWKYQSRNPADSWSDRHSISPDGSCSSSRFFGEACYYFKNGDLVREFISASTWELTKHYMKIIKDPGYLCGFSTSGSDPKLVSSPYPSSDANFLRKCTWY